MIRVFGFLLWGVFVAVGMFQLTVYSTTPGERGHVPACWPERSQIPRADGEQQLLVFLHPGCACSLATVRELQQVMAGDFPVVTHSVFFVPGGADSAWKKAEMIRASKTISTPYWDLNGEEAKHFGAFTSGHVILFNSKGDRLFSGGITAGRGHEGDSPGKTALLRLLKGEETEPQECPIFGCPIIPSNERNS